MMKQNLLRIMVSVLLLVALAFGTVGCGRGDTLSGISAADRDMARQLVTWVDQIFDGEATATEIADSTPGLGLQLPTPDLSGNELALREMMVAITMQLWSASSRPIGATTFDSVATRLVESRNELATAIGVRARPFSFNTLIGTASARNLRIAEQAMEITDAFLDGIVNIGLTVVAISALDEIHVDAVVSADGQLHAAVSSLGGSVIMLSRDNTNANFDAVVEVRNTLAGLLSVPTR